MTKTRRKFTAEQKAAIVRRHLKDKEPISSIAEELSIQPTQIHQWVALALEQVERAFEKSARSEKVSQRAEAKINELNLKMFVFDDSGYASIRMTQKNYFGGAYLGCDEESGLGFPSWSLLFAAYGIPFKQLEPGWNHNQALLEAWAKAGPAAFEVPLDPEQTFFPKISSRVKADGGMESNPLHLMSPELGDEESRVLMRYLN
jgi:hypothetical protein